MKKTILTSLAFVVGISLGYSQGTITIANTVSTYLISTNGASQGLGTGPAGTGANSYYYTVLTSTTAYPAGTVPGDSNAQLGNSADWQYTGVLAPNSGLTKGGVSNPGTTTTITGTWGAPSTSAYNSGTAEYYVIVGWSSSEGTSWSTVASELANNTLVSGGWFGVSPVAYDYSGGGPQGDTVVNVLNAPGETGLAGAGLSAGFDLYPVPEPTTIALGVLGAASLLALRRKKA
jgi:hypothetical protein